jgi:hypothetical protein
MDILAGSLCFFEMEIYLLWFIIDTYQDMLS